MATSKWITGELNFYHDVRLLQKRTKCSNYVCNQFVKTFQKHCGKKGDGQQNKIKSFDKLSIKAAGADYMVLHGCPNCNHHVYMPDDDNINCPFVKVDGTVCGYSRFDEKNEPYEVL